MFSEVQCLKKCNCRRPFYFLRIVEVGSMKALESRKLVAISIRWRREKIEENRIIPNSPLSGHDSIPRYSRSGRTSLGTSDTIDNDRTVLAQNGRQRRKGLDISMLFKHT
jgi:hypothetical protein